MPPFDSDPKTKALENRIQQLETVLKPSGNTLVLQVGASKIMLTPTDIVLQCSGNILIKTSGAIDIASGGNMTTSVSRNMTTSAGANVSLPGLESTST